jgi:hypothetical protein
MQEFDCCGRRLRPFAKEVTAEWLRREVRPNVAATFTLLQARRVENGGEWSWLPGNEREYGWAYNNLVHDLSQKHLGRAYRRYGKLVPNYAFLEGDGEIKRKHLHAAFRCPDHVEQDAFIRSIQFHWRLESPWAMDDMRIEPIRADWVGYTSKDGSEALLLDGLSF